MMRAISALSLEAGTSTFGWRATMALRTLVSISAIGSLVILARTSSAYQLALAHTAYQLAFTTPGISPLNASCRKHNRQIPYLRRNARGRPQRQQRLRWRHCSFGVFAFCALASLISFAIFAAVAMDFPFLLYCARNGMPICLSSALPSASVFAVVVMQIFMPLVF